jgi:hypothetical protein
VSALDSIEAPPRWRRQNLVDGHYVGVETNDASRADLARLQAERVALFRRILPEELRQSNWGKRIRVERGAEEDRGVAEAADGVCRSE